MKFLVDANLPFKIALNLKSKGFDVIHTDNLPNKEKTSDREIRTISVEQNRVVISKDSDFLDSHIIIGVPQKFLYISTGNIINRDLIKLIEENLSQIIDLFSEYNLIELDNNDLIAHEK
jgi:predicted nuclease of predicted toxin-antitoxin system